MPLSIEHIIINCPKFASSRHFLKNPTSLEEALNQNNITDNVRKQLKKSQIIFKTLSRIENANINIQWNFQVSTVIRFSITRK